MMGEFIPHAEHGGFLHPYPEVKPRLRNGTDDDSAQDAYSIELGHAKVYKSTTGSKL